MPGMVLGSLDISLNKMNFFVLIEGDRQHIYALKKSKICSMLENGKYSGIIKKPKPMVEPEPAREDGGRVGTSMVGSRL